MGGEPSQGTPADRRLKRNKNKPATPVKSPRKPTTPGNRPGPTPGKATK